jgi:D-inositol-3-phosphate glycosyltransferase
MRIALISEHASPAALLGGVDAGGQNVYLDELSRSLGVLGHEVDVITRRGSPGEPALREWAPGVRIVNLDAGPPAALPKDDLWPLMPAFRDAFLRFAHEQHAEYAVLHGNFWMSGSVAAQLAARLHIPVVQIFHATGLTKRRHQGEADTSPAERVAVERGVVQAVDALIAQCPSEQVELIDDYGADPARVELIPSAVNTRLFHPLDQRVAREALGLAYDEPALVYIGRILPRKDVRNIVRALGVLRAKGVTPPRLLIVGGETAEPDERATPEIGVLRGLARECGVAEHVAFAGRRQPHELALYYSAADVAITTPWYEPFGLTPLEAMACGTPVIGSAVGGITFTIADTVTGLLVPPADPPALAGAIERMLARPDERRRMGIAARERVEREFTWNTVARRTAALYERVLHESAAGALSASAGAQGGDHGTR